MEDMKKYFEEIIAALDGHTAITSEEADRILESGYMPVDEFIKRVKAAAEKVREAKDSTTDLPEEK